MENVSVNLDDGELWIPSDFLPMDELHHRLHCHGGLNNRPITDGGSLLDDLSRHSCKVKSKGPTRTVAQNSSPTPTPNGKSEQKVGPKRVVPGPTPSRALVSAPNGRSEQKVGHKGVDRSRFFNNRPSPVHHALCLPVVPFPVHQPLYPMAGEQLMETRIGRSLIHSHGQRGGHCRHHHKNNRVFPTQPSGHEFGFWPISNTSLGTGVFIPRTNSVSCEVSQNNPGVKPQNIPPRKLGTKKDLIPPPDEGLPKDWTY